MHCNSIKATRGDKMTTIYKAKIRYFDNLTGVGVVRVPELNDQCFKVHYSADRKRFQKEWVSFEQDEQVLVTIYHDSHWSQVDTIEQVNN
jgi:hypothetical protein